MLKCTTGKLLGGAVFPIGVEFSKVIKSDQYKGSTKTTEDVGGSTTKVSSNTFFSENQLEGMDRRFVFLFFKSKTRVHHHTTTDGINGVCSKTRNSGDRVTKGEFLDEGRGTFGVTGHQITGGIVDTKVQTTVNNDTNSRNRETIVNTTFEPTGRFGGFEHSVQSTFEFTVFTDTGVHSHTGTGKIKGVDHKKGSGTGSTTGGDVVQKTGRKIFSGQPVQQKVGRKGLGLRGGKKRTVVSPGLVLQQQHTPLGKQIKNKNKKDIALHFVGDFFVFGFEGKVQRLGREVTVDVGHVTTPERHGTLFGWDTFDDVHDAFVWFFNTFGVSLILQKEFDALDGGSNGFRHGSRDTGKHKVFGGVEFFDILVLFGGGHREGEGVVEDGGDHCSVVTDRIFYG